MKTLASTLRFEETYTFPVTWRFAAGLEVSIPTLLLVAIYV